MSNPFYDHTTFPQAGSPGSSAAMRAELAAIETGFDQVNALKADKTELPDLSNFQPKDATLTALAALNFVADRMFYATGPDTFSLATITATARSLLAAATSADGRTVLGAQTSSALLTAIAGLTSAANKLPYFTGVNTAAVTDLTALGRLLIGSADAASARTVLGVNGSYAELTGATFTGDVQVPDDVYDPSEWNSNYEAPTKNAVRDKIESIVSHFVTAGTAPTFTLNGLTLYGNAYVNNERIRLAFNASVSSGAATLNRDALGAVAIKQYDSTGAKVNSVIVSGQIYDIEFDGTDYVILNPTVPVYNSILDLASGQIKFPATQNPSSNANTLDDYEEGTWTPDVQGVTGTIQSVSGNYVKVGRMITYSALITGVTTVAFTNGTSYINNFPTNATPSIPCQFAVGGGSGAGNYTSRGLFIVNPAIDGGWLPTSAAAKYHIVTGTYISTS